MYGESDGEYTSDSECSESEDSNSTPSMRCDAMLMINEFMNTHKEAEVLSDEDRREFVRLYDLYRASVILYDLPYNHTFESNLSKYYRRALMIVL